MQARIWWWDFASQEHVILANQGAEALMRKAAVRYFGSSSWLSLWGIGLECTSPKLIAHLLIPLIERYLSMIRLLLTGIDSHYVPILMTDIRGRKGSR